MNDFISSLMWTVLGIVLDRLYERVGYPYYHKLIKFLESKKMKKLYYGEKTLNFVKKFYSDKLYNCKIGNISKVIPFLVNDKWNNLDVNILSNPNILMYVNTDDCKYPVRKKVINRKIRRGKRLFNNPSLFLHRIVYNNRDNNIVFEVGEYNYFQRISYVSDFEKETFNCSYRVATKPKLRKRYLANVNNASIASENTIPIGCDTVFAIKRNSEYEICIHKRSEETVNYPEGYMVVPSFGFGSIKKVDDNPLLYSFLKEYCEEVFNREEMDQEDDHVNPYWFYHRFEEVDDVIDLIKNNKFYFHLIGCGFDAIGGFFNITLLAVIDDEQLSRKIYDNCNGNWETFNHSIKFISISSDEINKIFESGKLSPSSSFAISRAIQVLSERNRNVGDTVCG